MQSALNSKTRFLTCPYFHCSLKPEVWPEQTSFKNHVLSCQQTSQFHYGASPVYVCALQHHVSEEFKADHEICDKVALETHEKFNHLKLLLIPWSVITHDFVSFSQTYKFYTKQFNINKTHIFNNKQYANNLIANSKIIFNRLMKNDSNHSKDLLNPSSNQSDVSDIPSSRPNKRQKSPQRRIKEATKRSRSTITELSKNISLSALKVETPTFLNQTSDTKVTKGNLLLTTVDQPSIQTTETAVVTQPIPSTSFDRLVSSTSAQTGFDNNNLQNQSTSQDQLMPCTSQVKPPEVQWTLEEQDQLAINNFFLRNPHFLSGATTIHDISTVVNPNIFDSLQK